MYVTTCHSSPSVIPTPCCVAPFGGIAVPGTPLLIVLNMSASESPCFFGVRVKSGPRPPPLAPSPWQNAQFARNSNSPSLATFASPAYGFFACAAAEDAATRHTSITTAKSRRQNKRGRTFIRRTPLRKSKPNQASVTYIQDAVISRETIASRGTQLASHKFYETHPHLYFANSVGLHEKERPRG